MADPLARIQQLSPEKRELLMRRLAQARQDQPKPADDLARVARENGTVPLSFTQESAWFLDQLSPADPAHNITGALRFDGQLSLPALTAALGTIVRRHEPLRARFVLREGKPAQTLDPPGRLPVHRVDLSGLPAEQRQPLARHWFLAETQRGFDLTRDRLLRATLVRCAPQDHLLVLSTHHIAADGWSIGVLMGELATLYGAAVEGHPAKLVTLPIRYGDFASWQRRRLHDARVDQELDYWRRQLDDPPPILELPADGPAPAPGTPDGEDREGATCERRLDAELRRALDQLGREHDTTLFVTLLTTFLVLLARSTGRNDLVVGTPLSGRRRVETEGLVGRFLNTLALRLRYDPGQSFRQTLAAVRTTFLEGLEHSELPFERVVQAVDPDRAHGNHPLFETVFNFTPAQTRDLELPGVRVRYEEPPRLGAQFSMELFVADWEGQLELKLLYPATRFTSARMESFLEQLEHLLVQAIETPDTAVGAIDLLTARSHRLLPDPSVALDEPEQRTVPDQIATWCRQTPGETALRHGPTTVTYAQLGHRMVAVADALRAQGLETGQVVVINGHRCPGVMVSMAGTLLSGGVLLTLSSDLPDERLQQMVTEAKARFVLQVGPWREEDRWLRQTSGLEVLAIAPDGRVRPDSEPGDELAALADDGVADDAVSTKDDSDAGSLERYLASTPDVPQAKPGKPEPAYVFFTSGSTGKPKGILGTHAGLGHYVAWQRETFGVGPGDRVGQLTGLSFDVVLRDIFLPLTSGATLVLPADEGLLASNRVLRWLDDEGITRLHTVPAVVETWLLDPPGGVSLERLRTVFFAGEPLTADLVHRWRRTFPQAGEVINLYGPTETTLSKCFYRVPDTPRRGIQPLGRAMPQAQALVLTPEGADGRRRCTLGEPGEIAIRTPFRTLGFLNAPEDDARFLVNPFRDDPDDLLYLSGDRGVYGAGGELEFLGRLDHQVKVRGVRVEPSEVAATLQTCPEVATCAVVVRDDTPGGAVLVAYVVAAVGETGEAEEEPAKLRRFLRQRLPAAMVPSVFVFLDKLPLTANHKVDRRRLPTPDGMRPKLENRYVAPRDALELRLVQLWETLLDVRPIGVADSFFELGGHSLLALNLLVDTEQQLGAKVPLPALFAEPTIQHLATVARQQNDDPWPTTVPLWSAEHRQTLFLVHPGGGILWNYVHLVRHLAAGVPIVGLQARGLDGQSQPHRDLEQMAADYVAEILTLQSEGPFLLAGHSLGGLIAFEMARQLEAAGHRVGLLALLDSHLETTRSGADDSPGASDAERERDQDARNLATMVKTIEGFAGRTTDITVETLRPLSIDAQLDHVVDALERSQMLPMGAGREQTRTLLEVSKAHVQARRAYHPQELAAPITLIRAQEGRSKDGADDETLGWSRVATRPVEILWTPGDHVTMLSEPQVETLASSFGQLLEDRLLEEATED